MKICQYFSIFAPIYIFLRKILKEHETQIYSKLENNSRTAKLLPISAREDNKNNG